MDKPPTPALHLDSGDGAAGSAPAAAAGPRAAAQPKEKPRVAPPAKAVQQSPLLVLCPILPEEAASLLDVLRTMGESSPVNKYVSFSKMSTMHFCRFVVIPADRGAPPTLAFSGNYDGDLEAHLDELIAAGKQDDGRQGLVDIYRHCEGFPEKPDAGAIKRYLREHLVDTTCFYVGHRGYSQPVIQNDIAVRAAIEKHLRSLPDTGSMTPEELRAGIQKALAADPTLMIEKFDRELPVFNNAWLALPAGIVLALLGASWFYPPTLGVFALPVLFVSGWYALLRIHEHYDVCDMVQTAFPTSNLQSLEDKVVQNQLTHIVRIKPGPFRLFTLKGVLWAINFLAKYKYNKGDLGGIPSIHFARWVIIDGGKRLLFFSNYDSSWESYLGDFIGKAAGGLTGVWSNTEGFPRARQLVNDGATNAELFKQWTRRHQIPTQVWYSAYPHVTIPNVLQNFSLRENVKGELTGAALTAWLRQI